MANNQYNAEYFIDKDPGYDKATKIEYFDEANITLNLQKSNLKPGFHLIGIRIKAILEGKWSQNAYYSLYISEKVNSFNDCTVKINTGDTILNFTQEPNSGIKILKKNLKAGLNNLMIEPISNNISGFPEYFMLYNDANYNCYADNISYQLTDTAGNLDISKMINTGLKKEPDNSYSFKISRISKDSAKYKIFLILKDKLYLSSQLCSKNIIIPKFIENAVPIDEQQIKITDNVVEIKFDKYLKADIYNVMGELVYTKYLDSSKVLDISCLPKDVYWIVFKNESECAAYKFVKK